MMFDHFFKTQTNSKQEITLLGKKQQKHVVQLEADQTIEYFELDKIIKPCNKTIQNLKACDYVLADHSRKRLLFCELKNSQDRKVIKGAETQLDHSKHIINLFLNIFEEGEYSYALLVLRTKKMSKRTTKTRRIQQKNI
ncbi:hypothetical protein BHECKSOX_1247 [Bathymodiolus heckerae thiotrophic gill symbiont]|uniref:hypothetical protein n=1 Tax=Bathymodiolus heckerae thiotrophic gill symbiont TaxID=1052212 RepID=UPI0010B050B7|nr:hypothetical protein [Bathymodiolus heckerae thiotrophic gill symbiont]CAC9952207.1 hypothetical protein [uncultured Gammaproteobacteria bacterium]SHN89196.1 hypothetical protein BHECKSOX_1247 [Bathymodiolus heckerae thiotrophic gill symbiont]